MMPPTGLLDCTDAPHLRYPRSEKRKLRRPHGEHCDCPSRATVATVDRQLYCPFKRRPFAFQTLSIPVLISGRSSRSGLPVLRARRIASGRFASASRLCAQMGEHESMHDTPSRLGLHFHSPIWSPCVCGCESGWHVTSPSVSGNSRHISRNTKRPVPESTTKTPRPGSELGPNLIPYIQLLPTASWASTRFGTRTQAQNRPPASVPPGFRHPSAQRSRSSRHRRPGSRGHISG
jgi:hypothetical protein